jgi:hypothetical protein
LGVYPGWIIQALLPERSRRHRRCAWGAGFAGEEQVSQREPATCHKEPRNKIAFGYNKREAWGKAIVESTTVFCSLTRLESLEHEFEF